MSHDSASVYFPQPLLTEGEKKNQKKNMQKPSNIKQKIVNSLKSRENLHLIARTAMSSAPTPHSPRDTAGKAAQNRDPFP